MYGDGIIKSFIMKMTLALLHVLSRVFFTYPYKKNLNQILNQNLETKSEHKS